MPATAQPQGASSPPQKGFKKPQTIPQSETLSSSFRRQGLGKCLRAGRVFILSEARLAGEDELFVMNSNHMVLQPPYLHPAHITKLV